MRQARNQQLQRTATRQRRGGDTFLFAPPVPRKIEVREN